MPERPRFSRFRRLPGLYRFADAKPPDLNAEPQLLALYLPAGVLDRAEKLAMRAGSETVQDYCTRLLHEAIKNQEQQVLQEVQEARQGTLESLDELTSDPDYVSQWSAQSRHREEGEPTEVKLTSPDESASNFPSASETIFRHAALGSADPEALLVKLRRGEAIGPELLAELAESLAELEASLRLADRIDRRLAYALHKLAFEGQILLTEGLTPASADPATVDAVRRVQEGVDRILSGEDIRYFAESPGHDGNPGATRP